MDPQGTDPTTQAMVHFGFESLSKIRRLENQLKAQQETIKRHRAADVETRPENFQNGCPPVFSRATDPLEADDWLRAVERKLNIAQCDNQQKVLYASGQLQGEAQDWWESFEYGCPANAPPGLIELKQEEFRALKQGSMSIAEYRDKFAQLSRYAPNEVADDADKQCCFLKGLYDGLQLQLMSNTYPNFQTLVNHAIVIDNKRKEMEAKKRRLQGQAFGSNTRPRTNPQQGFQQRF
ncbi:uncharacterized protein [Miscanthus floridulus]|uniref:uncharacterized protein n=1 Tax=Miscanthus floridulus TaxID=154761 RepID=UPI003457A04D